MTLSAIQFVTRCGTGRYALVLWLCEGREGALLCEGAKGVLIVLIGTDAQPQCAFHDCAPGDCAGWCWKVLVTWEARAAGTCRAGFRFLFPVFANWLFCDDSTGRISQTTPL